MQAVVLEGKYWRRRIEAVAEEYHKWRLWYRMRRKRQQQVQAGEARQPEVAAGPPVTDDMTLWDLNLGGWHQFGGWRGEGGGGGCWHQMLCFCPPQTFRTACSLRTMKWHTLRAESVTWVGV